MSLGSLFATASTIRMGQIVTSVCPSSMTGPGEGLQQKMPTNARPVTVMESLKNASMILSCTVPLVMVVTVLAALTILMDLIVKDAEITTIAQDLSIAVCLATVTLSAL